MSEGEVMGCRACREGFNNAEEQRAHYRTDFHRFNLKRKVAGLPPVSRATFEAKFPQLQQQQQQQQAQEQPEPVVEAPPPKTEEELIQEKLNNAQVIPLSQCIFCRKPSRNFQKNMEHMTKEHGFFVPDLEYTTSLQGLVTYLSQKISVGNVCLYCNRAFQTMEAVQAHMVSVSHCKMYYSDDVDEYDEFYDFTKSYDDVVLPDEPVADAADAASANEEEEKEKGDAHADQEVEVESQVVVSEDGYSMQFKDGRTAGHRALTLYYRQKPKPTETRDSVLINTLMKQYQTLGMVTKYKKPHTSEVGTKGTQRRMQYHYVKLGVQSNKLSKYLHARSGDESI